MNELLLSWVLHGTMAAMDQTPSTQELQDALRSRLIESGEYERLLTVLKSRLNEAGWEDRLRDIAREKTRLPEPPTLSNLVQDIEPKALETIPSSIREEIELMISSFVEKNVE